LIQYQYFRKTAANARLQLAVTDTFLEAIDANPGPPTALECPWLLPTSAVFVCQRIMWSWVSFKVS
jgi:hypothetical protein